MLFFYVRHGDPIYNPDSLTEQGHRQAKALVERMKLCNPEKIYVSSSNRAMQTARPTAEYLGLETETLDWCNEHYAWMEFSLINDQGARQWLFQNEEYVRLMNSREVCDLGDAWWQHPGFANTDAAAGWERICRETDAFMASLGYNRNGNGFECVKPTYQRVALFAHQGFGLAFLSCLLHIPYPHFATHFDMGHSGVTVIELADQGFAIPKVLQLANDSHIFADSSLTTNYQNRIVF